MSMLAKLYTPISSGVRCDLCARRCVIPEGKVGFCNVRRNFEGNLLTDIYGALSIRYIDDIEKKLQFHFNPGSATYSFGTTSCNFRCKFCINFELSTEKGFKPVAKVWPSEIVEAAVKTGCQGISFTYNEPTIFFEYAYDTAKLARKSNLNTVLVTNGYMTPEAIEMIAPYIDAVTLDFKGSGNSNFYKEICDVHNVQPIFECAKMFRDKKVHVEISNIVMLEHGDSDQEQIKLGKWVLDNLGPETPLHLLSFMYGCLLDNKGVGREHVIELSNSLRSSGLKYVYSDFEKNTNCPECGEQLIGRSSSSLDYRYAVTYNLTSNYACPKCGTKIPIIGTCHTGKAASRNKNPSGDGYYGWDYGG